MIISVIGYITLKARMLLSGCSRQVVPVMLKVRQKRPALNRRIPPSRHKVLTMVVRKAKENRSQASISEIRATFRVRLQYGYDDGDTYST